eukprot:Colp12_sorted_trinity150504_noHs@36319
MLARIPGLLVGTLTDRDGVVIAKAVAKDYQDSSKRSLLSTLTAGSEQASKLGVGKCESVLVQYKDRQLLHFAVHPLVVSFLALPDANMGLLMDLEKEIRAALAPLASSLRPLADSQASS